MEDTGIRRRLAPDKQQPPATEETAELVLDAKPDDQYQATIAAPFYTNKGTDLLHFAQRKVETHSIITNIIVSDDNKYNVLLMSLPFENMLWTAEELALRKRDLEGQVRTFTADDVDAFTTSRNAQALFTQSEQILLLEYCLDRIKPDANFDDVIANESILEWCKRQHYLEDVFPLHHAPTAKTIMSQLSPTNPLLDVGALSKIQDYFGDKVALYFAFLNFYTKALIFYAMIAVLVTALSHLLPNRSPLFLFFYSIFAALWGAALIGLWKRKNIEIVYMWTSLIMGDSSDESLMSMTKKEDLRRKFFGIETSHRITGEKIIVFPKRQKMIRFALSTCVVLISLFLSSKIMIWALDLEDIMNAWLEQKAHLYKWSRPYIMQIIVLKNVPMAVYLACLNILDAIYSVVARKLTENENHKYNSEFENSLVLKLVLFQFLNMNMGYLYIAFVRQNYERLASSMRSVLMVELVIGNIKEVVVPIFFAKRARNAKLAEALAKKKAANPDLDESEITIQLSDLDPISTQLDMEPYDGVFNDYFELVRQFAQISLFAAAFPIGACLATLNNLIEIYTDSYKLVHMTRRASPKRALDIGAWIRAFEFISIMSILTNLGIITVTAKYADAVVGKGISKNEEYFWMVVIEHGLLVSRYALMTIFEGIPSWVRDQRAKERYLASKQPVQQTTSPTTDSQPTSPTDPPAQS